MRALLDTNIVLDVLLQRMPWQIEAEAILLAVREERLACCVAALTVTNVFYVACDDAYAIWTAATGVAAFQGARIPPRVSDRKSLADTSRFEKRWFRPPHSKCLAVLNSSRP